LVHFKGDENPIIDGVLHRPINSEDSWWYLEDGKLHIELLKSKSHEAWPDVFVATPEPFRTNDEEMMWFLKQGKHEEAYASICKLHGVHRAVALLKMAHHLALSGPNCAPDILQRAVGYMLEAIDLSKLSKVQGLCRTVLGSCYQFQYKMAAAADEFQRAIAILSSNELLPTHSDRYDGEFLYFAKLQYAIAEFDMNNLDKCIAEFRLFVANTVPEQCVHPVQIGARVL
jgi:hypothetical protein